MQALMFTAALCVAALLTTTGAAASEGHDHGDAAAATAGAALPRFAAVSDSFELVGVLSGRQLTLYLDRFADNSPVPDAEIELEMAGKKFKAARQGDATYEVLLAEAPKPGVLPITASVTAGSEADLLAGELDLHEDGPVADAVQPQGWQAVAAWAAAGLGVLLVMAWVLRRRTAASPSLLLAGFALTLGLSTSPLPAHAGEGHDHGDGAAAPSANGPQRQPDGSVFLPKPAQRQLGVRTIVTAAAELPRTVELNAMVLMDPNFGGKVQALVAGRLEAGPGGLPSIGQSVRKGQVLAYVNPSSAAIERSNQAAQLAELRAAKALADKRLARLKELADTVPRKDIEAAESEAGSLAERAAALGAGLSSRDTLVAPASGVIAAANAVAGQVLDARELVFEIVDPAWLRIEALAFDTALAANIGAASLAIGNERVPLVFVGAGRSLREQALPLAFRAQGAALSQLAVGQPVRVFVQTKTQVKGIAVPVASLLKNPANQSIVWVKTAPERFEPRTVTTEPLDGVNVAVTSGLQAGDRVATQGATLINQVR